MRACRDLHTCNLHRFVGLTVGTQLTSASVNQCSHGLDILLKRISIHEQGRSVDVIDGTTDCRFSFSNREIHERPCLPPSSSLTKSRELLGSHTTVDRR